MQTNMKNMQNNMQNSMMQQPRLALLVFATFKMLHEHACDFFQVEGVVLAASANPSPIKTYYIR
jgi:hypothetical protein